jgi:hypothetical protein
MNIEAHDVDYYGIDLLIELSHRLQSRDVNFMMGTTALLTDDLLKAKVYFQRSFDEGNMSSSVFLGHVCERLGEVHEAEDYYMQGAFEGFEVGNYFMGHLELRRHDISKAEFFFKKALSQGVFVAKIELDKLSTSEHLFPDRPEQKNEEEGSTIKDHIIDMVLTPIFFLYSNPKIAVFLYVILFFLTQTYVTSMKTLMAFYSLNFIFLIWLLYKKSSK